jgi:hypothetical protein
MIVEGDPFFDSRRERIIALATHHSVVGCYPWREYAVLGGLMSYGSNLPDAYRQSAHYVGRICTPPRGRGSCFGGSWEHSCQIGLVRSEPKGSPPTGGRASVRTCTPYGNVRNSDLLVCIHRAPMILLSWFGIFGKLA